VSSKRAFAHSAFPSSPLCLAFSSFFLTLTSFASPSSLSPNLDITSRPRPTRRPPPLGPSLLLIPHLPRPFSSTFARLALLADPRINSLHAQLLTKDPARRLGASEADAAEIKSHLFFKDTNWDDVFHKRIPSPFYPAIVRPLALSLFLASPSSSSFERELTLPSPSFALSLSLSLPLARPQSSATDTSNFDKEFTSEQPTLTPVHSTLSAKDQQEFAAFDWSASWA